MIRWCRAAVSWQLMFAEIRIRGRIRWNAVAHLLGSSSGGCRASGARATGTSLGWKPLAPILAGALIGMVAQQVTDGRR